MYYRTKFIFTALIATLTTIGCNTDDGSSRAENTSEAGNEKSAELSIVGTWYRDADLAGRIQHDEYTFYDDGTFDHQLTSAVNGKLITNSGRWNINDNSIVCTARGFSDELIISDDKNRLVDLSNRAAGFPPYERFSRSDAFPSATPEIVPGNRPPSRATSHSNQPPVFRRPGTE